MRLWYEPQKASDCLTNHFHWSFISAANWHSLLTTSAAAVCAHNINTPTCMLNLITLRFISGLCWMIECKFSPQKTPLDSLIGYDNGPPFLPAKWVRDTSWRDASHLLRCVEKKRSSSYFSPGSVSLSLARAHLHHHTFSAGNSWVGPRSLHSASPLSFFDSFSFSFFASAQLSSCLFISLYSLLSPEAKG